MAGTLANMGGDGAARIDTRRTDIYAGEHRSLSFSEAILVLRKSWPFLARHRSLLVTKAVIALLGTTLYVLMPWPMKIVIDNVIDGRPLTGIPARLLLPLVGNDRHALLVALVTALLVMVVLAGISADRPAGVDTRASGAGLDQAGLTGNDANNGWSLWSGILGWVETWITMDLTQRVNQDIREAVYRRFLRSPLGLYSDQKIGDAVFRVMHDTALIADVFYAGILGPLLALATFLGAFAILVVQFSNEPLIPIVAFGVLPIVAVGSGLFGRILRDQLQRMHERGSQVMAAFEERLAQVQLIKAFGTEERETHNIDETSWSSFSATLRFLIIVFVLVLILAPAVGALVISVFYHLFLEVVAKRITLGDVVLLIGYALTLAIPMGILASTWAFVQGPIPGLRRAFSVLDRLDEGNTSRGKLQPDKINSLEFRDVAISYGDATPVVRAVSFAAKSGEMIAIAGPSGTGKTTVICSIPRFLNPCGGSVLVNGIDVTQFELAALRRRVGFVFQQEALFSRTIADNIRYGDDRASDEQLREAARLAGAAEFIEGLPAGYGTMLGRRGTRLSVGQKQRIAIARALIRQPDVLILDEPTAPLDPIAERALLATLRDLSRDRIVLIVGHRSGTLAACDRIVFMNDGAVAASGTHQELIASSAEYREYLAMAQSASRA